MINVIGIGQNRENMTLGALKAIEESDVIIGYRKYIKQIEDLIEDKENGVWKESEVEGRETAIITLEAPIAESGNSITVNGYYIVRGGLEVAAKGPGYAGRGHILKVIR